LDFVYQATLMRPVVVKKQSGDPVGDYTAQGTVHTLAVAFRHDL